jgi:hypothetical protein
MNSVGTIEIKEYRKLQVGKILDKYIFFLLSCVLMMDMLTGYFYNAIGIHFPISQIFKLFLMTLLIVRIGLFKNSPLLYLYLIVTYIIIIFLLFLSKNEVTETIILFSKFLMTVLVYIYFRKLFLSNANILPRIDKILSINFMIIIFNILVLGIMGLGFSQYSDENITTNKGFFYAGNELSVLAIVLFSYMLFKSYSAKWKYRKLLSLILLATAIYAGTKTMILGIIILCLLIPKITISIKNKSTYLKKTFKIIIFIFVSIIIIIGGYRYLVSSGVWKRWSFFYAKNGMSSIFSGRLEFVQEEISEYFDASILYKIMGLGGNRTVEMDFFDVLLNFGIFGVFIVYVFYIIILENARRLRKNKNYPYARLSFVTLIIILCISFFAGHTIFSGMAGIFIGILCALTFYKKQDDKNISRV